MIIHCQPPPRPPIWKLCDGNRTNDILQIQNVNTIPFNPRSGSSFTIVMDGVLSKPVYDDTFVDVDMAYSGVPLFSIRLHLCNVFLPCPIPAGPTQQSVTEYISVLTPPGGPYTGTIRIANKHGENVTCVNYFFMMVCIYIYIVLYV
jgi:hypothetical protein